MRKNDAIAAIVPDVMEWRKTIHANPELGFQEVETGRLIAGKLREFGLEVATDVSGTAVIGTLKRGDGGGCIGLRAELDALPIEEASGVDYASRNPGAMHACGHDGHSAILLGAARALSSSDAFDGTVQFIFQPAEEVVGGGRKLISDGFLERYPLDRVFSLHNWPGFPKGRIGVRAGPQMAAVDDFSVTFSGAGAHAAMPHLGDDPILAAAEFVTAVQRAASRSVDPLKPFVLSVTQIHGGRFNNFVPTETVVEGTCRYYDTALSAHAEAEIGRVAEAAARMHGVKAAPDYRRGYPPVVNPAPGAALALSAARSALGAQNATADFEPSMGCEDFAFLLNAVGDGAYAWIGAGEVGPRAGLHGDRFIFEDDLIEPALRYWLDLVRAALPPGGG